MCQGRMATFFPQIFCFAGEKCQKSDFESDKISQASNLQIQCKEKKKKRGGEAYILGAESMEV